MSAAARGRRAAHRADRMHAKEPGERTGSRPKPPEAGARSASLEPGRAPGYSDHHSCSIPRRRLEDAARDQEHGVRARRPGGRCSTISSGADCERRSWSSSTAHRASKRRWRRCQPVPNVEQAGIKSDFAFPPKSSFARVQPARLRHRLIFPRALNILRTNVEIYSLNAGMRLPRAKRF